MISVVARWKISEVRGLREEGGENKRLGSTPRITVPVPVPAPGAPCEFANTWVAAVMIAVVVKRSIVLLFAYRVVHTGKGISRERDKLLIDQREAQEGGGGTNALTRHANLLPHSPSFG